MAGSAALVWPLSNDICTVVNEISGGCGYRRNVYGGRQYPGARLSFFGRRHSIPGGSIGGYCYGRSSVGDTDTYTRRYRDRDGRRCCRAGGCCPGAAFKGERTSAFGPYFNNEPSTPRNSLRPRLLPAARATLFKKASPAPSRELARALGLLSDLAARSASAAS